MLIKLSDKEALARAGIYLSVQTLYKWRQQNKCPELFIKDGKLLLIDVDVWNRRLARLKSERTAEIADLKKRGLVNL